LAGGNHGSFCTHKALLSIVHRPQQINLLFTRLFTAHEWPARSLEALPPEKVLGEAVGSGRPPLRLIAELHHHQIITGNAPASLSFPRRIHHLHRQLTQKFITNILLLHQDSEKERECIRKKKKKKRRGCDDSHVRRH